jgi:hypothetical protein
MRRTAVAVALLLVASAAQVAATSGYAPPERVLPCTGAAQVTATADGSVWGLASCDTALRLIHRTPAGTWSSRALPFVGYPRAVADDGRTTFFLFASPYRPGDNALSIAKVPHGGPPSAARELQSLSEDAVNATLVARDGRWWAVWQPLSWAPERTSYATALYQARTMEPAFGTNRVDLGSGHDVRPRLALRGSGAVLTVTRGLGDDGYAGTRPVLAVAGADGRFAVQDLALPLSDRSTVEALVVAGGRTLLALRDGDRTLLAQDAGDLAFTTRTVPTRAAPPAVALAASYGRVFVAHGESFRSSAGAFTARVYVAEAGATGAFTTTEVSAPFGRTDPAVQAYLVDVTASRGHATALTTARGGTWSQTQR